MMKADAELLQQVYRARGLLGGRIAAVAEV